MADKTYKIYENRRQLKVTLNQAIAQAIGIKKGDRVKWIIDRGELILRKEMKI
jgi:formylmethanofuran dehydrogenase subunit D